jgi:hypothetical protein
MVFSLQNISGTHFLYDCEAHVGLLALHSANPPMMAIALENHVDDGVF